LIAELLRARTGLDPRQDVHPDLCVALGAGVLASRLAGHAIERVLVDVSPYSFGVSYLGERGGVPYPHCYKPIVPRNTPLPLTRTERYATAYPYQTTVEVQVYQGDDEDALRNILVGDFRIEGLTPTEEPNEILCRMHLDLEGLLDVTAIEKRSGASKHITIVNALRAKSAEEIAAGQRRIRELYESRSELLEQDWATPVDVDDAVLDAGRVEILDAEGAAVEGGPAPVDGDVEARRVLERSRRALDQMHAEDREEAIELHERIEAAIDAGNASELRAALGALEELLFFVEGLR